MAPDLKICGGILLSVFTLFLAYWLAKRKCSKEGYSRHWTKQGRHLMREAIGRGEGLGDEGMPWHGTLPIGGAYGFEHGKGSVAGAYFTEE